MRTSKLIAHSESLKATTVKKVEQAMMDITNEVSKEVVSPARITLRSVCARAGITEQTLHKKDHKSLKQKVLDWREGLVPKPPASTSKTNNALSADLASERATLGNLAAEIVVLKKSLLDAQEENRQLIHGLRKAGELELELARAKRKT